MLDLKSHHRRLQRVLCRDVFFQAAQQNGFVNVIIIVHLSINRRRHELVFQSRRICEIVMCKRKALQPHCSFGPLVLRSSFFDKGTAKRMDKNVLLVLRCDLAKRFGKMEGSSSNCEHLFQKSVGGLKNLMCVHQTIRSPEGRLVGKIC